MWIIHWKDIIPLRFPCKLTRLNPHHPGPSQMWSPPPYFRNSGATTSPPPCSPLYIDCFTKKKKILQNGQWMNVQIHVMDKLQLPTQCCNSSRCHGQIMFPNFISLSCWYLNAHQWVKVSIGPKKEHIPLR